MREISKNFLERLKANYKPLIYLLLSSNSQARIFGKEKPELAGGSLFWDGSWLVGDGADGLIQGISSTGARVVSFGQLRLKAAFSAQDLIGSLQQNEIQSLIYTLDNTDAYFSDILSGDIGDSFLQNTASLILGFSGLSKGEYITLDNGIVSQEHLAREHVRIVSDSTTRTLYENYTPVTAGIYSDPGDEASFLPIVYGDCTENTGERGVVFCPLIDVATKKYCLAGHAIYSIGLSSFLEVYDDTGNISNKVSSIVSDSPYQEQLSISYIQISGSYDPVGNVTAKFRGKASSGNPAATYYTNPVDVVQDFLSFVGDATPQNATSFSKARQFADDQGYECAGFIVSENTPFFTINDILSSFLGRAYLNSIGELVIDFEQDLSRVYETAGTIRESGIMSVSGSRNRKNIINQVIVNYALTGDKKDRRYKRDVLSNFLVSDDGESTKDTESQALYGVRNKTLDLNWVRKTANVAQIQEYIVEEYKKPTWIMNIQEQDMKNVAVEPNDYVLFSWQKRYDEDGERLKNQIGKVVSVGYGLNDYTMQYEIKDTGKFLLSEPLLWDGSWGIGDGTETGRTRDRGDY